MLMIRLKRVGRRNQPAFRVVVVEKTRGPKSNDVVDTIGFHDPITKEQDLKTDKAKHWIAQGAQPSDRVYNMLVDAGVIAGKKRNVLSKKTPILKEKPAEEVKAEAPAAAETTPEAASEAATSSEVEVKEEKAKTVKDNSPDASEEAAPAEEKEEEEEEEEEAAS